MNGGPFVNFSLTTPSVPDPPRPLAARELPELQRSTTTRPMSPSAPNSAVAKKKRGKLVLVGGAAAAAAAVVAGAVWVPGISRPIKSLFAGSRETIITFEVKK